MMGSLTPKGTKTRMKHLLLALAALGVLDSLGLAQVQWPVASGGNGHYYQVVAGTYSWSTARTAAAASTYLGVQGHLATIGDAAENAFVRTLPGIDSRPWIGAFQPPGSPEPNGNWSWVTGEPFEYKSWFAGSPSDSWGVEDYAQIGPEGKWNDLQDASIPIGYIVEFETTVDLVAVGLAWNTTADGLDARYKVDGGALSMATTAKLFWANGTSVANILPPGTPIVTPETIPAGTGGPGSSGVITFNVPASAFAAPLSGTTHILLVLNQDGEVSETNPNNNSVALGAQELVAQSIDWGNPAGGVRFQYDVAIAPLMRPTTAKLFWADGPTIDDIMSANPPFLEPIYSLDIPAGSLGPVVVNVPASLFMSPPPDATHVLLALDYDPSNPDGQILEAREDNNVLPMRFATLKITSHRLDSIIEAPIEPTMTPSVLRYGYAVNVGKVEPRSCVLLKIQGPAGAPLRVYVTAIPDSGGHTHSGLPRPHGWLRKEQDGWQNFPPMQKSAAGVEPEFGYQSGSGEHSTYTDGLEVTTDNEGVAKVYYIASEFGGEEVVTAKTQAESEQQRMTASLPLTLAIPNLEQLPPSIYIDPTGDKKEHRFNHFGRADLLQALEALAVNYALETPRDTLPQNPAMRVNDMSLVTGGLFDCLSYCGGKEWKTPHKGHRFGVEVDVGLKSQPPNTDFERILREQGWWKDSPSLWASEGEGSHYHLQLDSGAKGKVTIRVEDPVVLDWDSGSGLLSFAVLAMNAGGINASDVVFTHIVPFQSAGSTVRILAPSVPAFLSALAIREAESLAVQAVVPPDVRQFFTGFRGTATGDGRAFDFPETTYLSWKTVRVPGRGSAASGRQPKDVDQWAFTLTDVDQPYTAGTNLVYHGTIQNFIGSDLFLASVDLDFRPHAPAGTYTCDLAEEFLATGGIIPVNGYSGPLVVVRWISAPPVGAVGTGIIRLGVNPSLSPLSAEREFRYSSSPQRLRIAHFGNGVECSWSTNATGLELQSTGEASEIEWDAVRAPVRRVGDEFRVYLDIPQRTRFFRLASANAPESYTLADLSLTMAAPALPQTLGIPFAFNLAVTNLGPELASGVVLTSPLPAGLSFVSANASQGQCTFSGGTVTCALGDLDAAQYAVVTLVVSPGAAGLIAASASVSAWQIDPDESNNVATASAIVNTSIAIDDAAVIGGNTGTNPGYHRQSPDGEPVTGRSRLN